MRKTDFVKIASIIITITALTACSALRFPGVYRIDIPQGNLVEEENVSQVKIGMEPRQVRYLLGTPLIRDTFNQDRWDYYYSLREGTNTTVQHHVSIFFANGRVTSIKDQLKQ